MPIPQALIAKLECCLANDGHIVHEPIVLKCGATACKICIQTDDYSGFKCFSCSNRHEKREIIDIPTSKTIENTVQLFLDDLFDDLDKKLEKTSIELKGNIFRLIIANSNLTVFINKNLQKYHY
jgi:hypothetical protein